MFTENVTCFSFFATDLSHLYLLLSVAVPQACRPAAAAADAAAVVAAIAVFIALTLTVAYNVGGLVVGWGMAIVVGGGCTGGVPVCQRPCGTSLHRYHAHSILKVDDDSRVL